MGCFCVFFKTLFLHYVSKVLLFWCLLSPGICQQRCTNLWGSYRCHCRPGFRLSSDGRTCADVDECRDYEGLCIGNCENEPGSYRQGCQTGGFIASLLWKMR